MFAPMKTDSTAAADRLVSITEAAGLLGISRRAAYYLVKRGDLPAVQYRTRKGRTSGGVLRIRVSEIDAFLKDSELTP